MENLQRIVQESVPGKQITLLHLISSPVEEVNERIGIESNKSIGILSLTPTETAIIAADVAAKSGLVEVSFIDRFNGTVLIQGDVQSVKSSLEEVRSVFKNLLKFTVCEVTQT